ncbi:MAG: family 43 glycosylhydrolase [Prevotella sp.]|nr:family 43 glycosylhydrolase [Prevotella sp.]
MRRTLYTAALLLLSLTGMAADKNATLTVYATTRYQHIDGFGGTAMTPDWRDAYTQQKVNLLWGQGQNQVGLNIMRIRINPNENNWGEYGNPIRWARQVCPDLQVFATPWTPPKKYKTHNTEKYQNDFGTWVWPLVEHSWGGEGSNGGAINPECYDEYADFLERYRQTMASKGCPIDIISIQNESDYTPTATDNGVEHASYESCIYSPSEMAAMVKALRQHLDSSCKIMGPECFGWGQHNYNNKLVTMADAVNNIDIWGNHLYGTNDWTFVQNVTNKTHRPMWETEYLIDYASGYDGNFTVEYPMIESIEKAMTSGYSAYVYYSMFTHFFASNHGGSDSQLWKRAWVFSHYAKNATGKQRIRSSLTNGGGILKGGSTYISEDGDTVVVMLLNTSTTDTYNVTVSLPFSPVRIQQVVTGPSANALKTDVTALYATAGSTKPKVQLQPGNFYTFLFIKNIDPEEMELATSVKQPEWANPLSASHFMADPTAVEYNGRMYVYATDDQQEFDFVGGLSQNSYGHISRLVCMSTDDLVNWTMHDPIDVKAIAPWAACSWAPSVVSRVESDGLTHFYLYFTYGASGIGVLTATQPTGPWTDPLGHALIDGTTPGLGQISWIIDPGAAVSDDGQEAYLTFGGGDILTGATELMPGNARIVKLGADMISLGSDIKPISAPCQFEANELNYINGKWYYTYCTRWNIASDWSTYSKKNAPGAASMAYMTSTDPLADKWTYQGVILPNPGTLGYPYGNNHSHLQKFNGGYYLLYHTQWLEHERGLSGGYRNIQLNKATLNTRTGIFTTFTSETAAITGVTQLANHYVNPFMQQSGRMAAVSTFSPLSSKSGIPGIMNWWMVRGVDFSLGDAPARSLILRVKGTGTIEVRPNNLTAETLATATFNSTDGEQQIEVALNGEMQQLCQFLYFVITDGTDAEVLSWQFSSQEAQGINTVHESFPAADNATYSLQGQRISNTQRGIYIRNGRKVIIR